MSSRPGASYQTAALLAHAGHAGPAHGLPCGGHPLPAGCLARQAYHPKAQNRRARRRKGGGIPDPAAPLPACSVPTARERACAAAALSRTHADLASRAPGTGRNPALNDAAFAMGTLVGAGWIERAEVERALLDARQRNGYAAKDGEHAALATLRSGLTAGMAHPRAPLADGGAASASNIVPLRPGLPIFGFNGQQLAPAVPVASPFVWRDPATIPPRAWLYGRHYIGQFVSATVAPGGVGKSSLVLAEALAMASGRNLIGHQPSGALNVWVINGEDPVDELQRRVTAAMLKHNLGPADTAGRLYVNSGRDTEFVIAETTKDGTKICRPIYDAILSEIKSKNIEILIVDPFVSFHNVSENDNNAINAVVKAFARIAHETGCAIELVHHSRKMNNNETTADDARGASALIAAARSVRMLNRMTDAEAAEAGVDAADAALYFRTTNGKANLARASGKKWCKIEALTLENGDEVATVVEWHWPNLTAAFNVDTVSEIQRIIGRSQYRKDHQSPDWIGRRISHVFGYDELPMSAAHKKQLNDFVDRMIAVGWLRVVNGQDGAYKMRQFVEMGTPVPAGAALDPPPRHPGAAE